MSLLLEVLRKHEAERRGDAATPPAGADPVPATAFAPGPVTGAPADSAPQRIEPLSLAPLTPASTDFKPAPEPPSPVTPTPEMATPLTSASPAHPLPIPRSAGRWPWIAGFAVAGCAGLALWVGWESRPIGLSPIPAAQARGSAAMNDVPAPDATPTEIPVPAPPPMTSHAPAPPAHDPAPGHLASHTRGTPPVRAGQTDTETPPALRFEARNTSPTSLLPELLAAHEAYTTGHHAAAQQHYLAVLALDPANPDAHDGLGALALRNGRPADAARHFRRALDTRPNDPAALAGLASLPGSDGRLAASRLRASLDVDAGDASAQFALGTALARQQRWAEAQQAYFRARTLAPDDPDIAYNLAVSLDHLRQPRPAALHYRLALQLAEGRRPGFDPAACAARLDALATQGIAP